MFRSKRRKEMQFADKIADKIEEGINTMEENEKDARKKELQKALGNNTVPEDGGIKIVGNSPFDKKLQELDVQRAYTLMEKKDAKIKKDVKAAIEEYPRWTQRMMLTLRSRVINTLSGIVAKMLLKHLRSIDLVVVSSERYKIDIEFTRIQGLRIFYKLIQKLPSEKMSKAFSGQAKLFILRSLEQCCREGVCAPIDLTKFEMTGILTQEAEDSLYKWMYEKMELVAKNKGIAEQERKDKEENKNVEKQADSVH